jgi:AcrR family transcriptional regulator
MAIRVTRKRPDAYQHGDLRRALVQAGLKLLGERGVAGLSLRAAAELAGVSHAAPYRHFRDKGALVAAIAEEGFTLLTRSMREEIDAEGSRDLLAKLRAAGRGYVSFALRHPAYFRTIFGEKIWPDASDADPGGASLRAAGEEAFGVLRGLVESGIREGRLRPGDVERVSLASWSLVHGLSLLIIDGRLAGLVDTDAAVRGLTDGVIAMLERGIAT